MIDNKPVVVFNNNPSPAETALAAVTAKELDFLSKVIFATDRNSQVIASRATKHTYSFPHSYLEFVPLVQKILAGEVPPAMYIDAHPGNRCDFCCIECFDDPILKGNKSFFPFPLFLSLIEEIATDSRSHGVEHVHLDLSGRGNPIIYKGIKPSIVKAAELGMHTTFTSTGSGLDNVTIDLLGKHAFQVKLSINGLNDNSYLQIHKPKNSFSLDKAKRNLVALLEARVQHGRERELLIGIQSFIHPGNAGSIFPFAEMVREMEVDYISFRQIIQRSGLPIDIPPGVYDEVDSARTLETSRFKVLSSSSRMKMFPVVDPEPATGFCFMSQARPNIEPDGGVYPCATKSDSSNIDWLFGRYNKPGDYKKIWYEEAANIRRKAPASCPTCYFWEINALAGWIGRVLTSDPAARFFQLIETAS